MEDLAIEKVRINISKVIDDALTQLTEEAEKIRSKQCGTVGNAEKELEKLRQIEQAAAKLESERWRIIQVVKNGGRCPYCAHRDCYY